MDDDVVITITAIRYPDDRWCAFFLKEQPPRTAPKFVHELEPYKVLVNSLFSAQH